MLGRRRHQRYAIAESTGTLQVSSDVTVQQHNDTDFVALASEARAPGEELVLELVDGPEHIRIPVRVVESRPIVFGESLRHRLRLIRIDQAG